MEGEDENVGAPVRLLRTFDHGNRLLFTFSCAGRFGVAAGRDVIKMRVAGLPQECGNPARDRPVLEPESSLTIEIKIFALEKPLEPSRAARPCRLAI